MGYVIIIWENIDTHKRRSDTRQARVTLDVDLLNI